MSGLTSSWHCLMASWSALLKAALTEVTLRLERRLYRGYGVDLSSVFGKLREGATLSSSISLSLSLEMQVRSGVGVLGEDFLVAVVSGFSPVYGCVDGGDFSVGTEVVLWCWG